MKNKNNQNSKVEHILDSINFSIGFGLCIYYTFKINLTFSSEHTVSIFALFAIWCITTILFGSILSVFSQFASFVIAQCKEDPKVFKRGYIPPGFESGTRSAFLSVGFATAYTMVLYYVGLTESFFSVLLIATS